MNTQPQDVLIYTSVFLQLWRERYGDNPPKNYDTAFRSWSVVAQRHLWSVGYDAVFYTDPFANCEVYERVGPDGLEPLTQTQCDQIEEALWSIAMV